MYFSVGGEYASLLKNSEDTSTGFGYNQDVTRLDFTPQVRFPFKKWQWFTVNTTRGVARHGVFAEPLGGQTRRSSPTIR